MTRRAMSRGFGVIVFAVALAAAGSGAARAHEGDTARYILAGDLVGELAYPGTGPGEAAASLRLTVTPSETVMCFELEWEAHDTPTGLVIRLGWPPEGSPDDTIEEIVIEISDDDILDEGDGRGIAIGCAEADHDPLDFIANEPGDSHFTVTTANYPDGTAGGWLQLERVSGGESENQEGSTDFDTVVFGASLTPESVAPDPPDLDGGGEAFIELTPDMNMVCWDVWWDIPDTTTAIHVHRGGSGEVGPIVADMDLIETTEDVGGESEDGYVTACFSMSEGFAFTEVADDPDGHYLDVHSEEYAEGALRGQLEFLDSFAQSFEEEKPEGSGGLSRFVPHLLATLLVGAATVAGVLIWRRGVGISTTPPVSGVALAASSYTMLLLSWLTMMLERILAPVSFDGAREVGDAWQLTLIGLWLALLTLLVAVVASRTSRDHPPLRRIVIVLGVAAVLMAVLWLGWNAVQPTYET